MNEELEKKVEAYYRELLELPMKVTEIFNDFYGEERVDLQPITFEEFVIELKKCSMYEITDGYSAFDICPYMMKHYDRELIQLYRSIAYKSTLINSVEIFDKFAPYMKTFVGNRFFNTIPIIIHFPHVTITNEYNDSVEVNNLWAQVPISWEGKGKGWFRMNRSEYDLVHMQSDYMHSHVNGIDFDSFAFRNVCTGSGPINSTLSSLTVDFDEPIWQLFCLELERYMGTESLIGGPYRKMQNIGANGNNRQTNFLVWNDYFIDARLKTFFKEFIKYLFDSNVLKFNYRKGSYGLATSFSDTVLAVSNAFIEWYNAQFKKSPKLPRLQDLMDRGIIKEAIIGNNAIYNSSIRTTRNFSEYQGKKVLDFKGKEVKLVIKGLADEARLKSKILHVSLIGDIIRIVLELLNCEYGNSKKTNSGIDKKKTRFAL